MTRRSEIVGISMLMMLAACGRGDPAGDPRAHPAVAVTSSPASTIELPERFEAGGVVTALDTAVLSSRIVAPVQSVRVRAGDHVRAGDVLVTLDGRDVAAQARQAQAALTAAEQGLAQARAELASAEAERKLATAWHTRISTLHQRKSATAQELDDADARLAGAVARATGARARIAQIEATVHGSRAGVDSATTIESFTVLRAPFDGLVTERLIDPGSLAAPGTPLVRLDSHGARRVEVKVDEARAADIRPGDLADVLFEGLAAEDENGGLEGRVTEVARAVSADQRAFTVKVTLPPTEDARTGTFARVRFRGAPRRALMVPRTAIRRVGQITSVFVIEQGLARLRLVQSGYVGPEGVEILSGLDEGEAVVTSPPASLADGDPISTPSVPDGGARR